MGMHGKFGSPDALPPSESLDFIADNYRMVTTGGGCSRSGSVTLEDGTLAVAASIKKKNPKVLVGMYWRTDAVNEIAHTGCSNYTAELAKLGTDIFLKDDKGALIKNGYYLWDYTNPVGADLFLRALVNVANQTLPNSSMPAIDYLYLDGPGYGDQVLYSA
jgi:hypothetical protein